MSEARLAPGVEVAALIALARTEGGFGAVLNRGDADRGSVMLVIAERGEPRFLIERMLQPTGEYRWEGRKIEDVSAATSRIRRLRNNDPDAWVVELDVPSAERFTAEIIAQH